MTDGLLLVHLALGIGPNGGTFDGQPLTEDEVASRVNDLPPRLKALAVTVAIEKGFPSGLVNRFGRTFTR